MSRAPQAAKPLQREEDGSDGGELHGADPIDPDPRTQPASRLPPAGKAPRRDRPAVKSAKRRATSRRR